MQCIYLTDIVHDLTVERVPKINKNAQYRHVAQDVLNGNLKRFYERPQQSSYVLAASK